MIVFSISIILLLVECCPANKSAGPHYDPTTPPRGNGGKSTHISEFTDPATGLNPFLDLEEGRTGEMGRNIIEEEELPRPLSDSDLQLIEGDPNDRGSSGRDQSFGRRWGHFNNKPQRVIPASSATDVSPTEWDGGNRRYGQFSTATEADWQIAPDISVPSIAYTHVPTDYYSPRPVEDHSFDYNTEYHVEEAKTEEEETTHPQKVPISENVLISAAITGASVAVIALLLAICWWRQKMKRVSMQGSANDTENNIESVISDKANTNGDIQKKAISV